MGDLRHCPARMYEFACELRYDHEGDHRQGRITWERVTTSRIRSAAPNGEVDRG